MDVHLCAEWREGMNAGEMQVNNHGVGSYVGTWCETQENSAMMGMKSMGMDAQANADGRLVTFAP